MFLRVYKSNDRQYYKNSSQIRKLYLLRFIKILFIEYNENIISNEIICHFFYLKREFE